MLLTKRGKANRQLLYNWLSENNALIKYNECVKNYKSNKRFNIIKFNYNLNHSLIFTAFMYRCDWYAIDKEYWIPITNKLISDLLEDKINVK